MDFDISDSSINDSYQQIHPTNHTHHTHNNHHTHHTHNNQSNSNHNHNNQSNKYKDYQKTFRENNRIQTMHHSQCQTRNRSRQMRSSSKPKTPTNNSNSKPNPQQYLKGTGCFKQLYQKNNEIQLLINKYQRYKQKSSKYKKKCMEMYSMIQLLEEKVKETEKYRKDVEGLEQRLVESQRIRQSEYEDMSTTINNLQQQLDQQDQIFKQKQQKQQQDDILRYENQIQEIEDKHFQLIQSNQQKSQIIKEKEQMLVQQYQQIDDLKKELDQEKREKLHFQCMCDQNEMYKVKYETLRKEIGEQQIVGQKDRSEGDLNRVKKKQSNIYHELISEIRNIKDEISELEYRSYR